MYFFLLLVFFFLGLYEVLIYIYKEEPALIEVVSP